MINKDEIIDILKRQYDIDVNKIIDVENGSSNLYIINEKYVIKIFQNEFDLRRVIKEIDIYKYLNKHFLVPNYIKTKDNKDFIIYNNRIIVLMDYIDGYNLKAHSANNKQVIDSAIKYSKLINVLKNYNGELPIYSKEKYTLENINRILNDIDYLISKTNDNDIIHDLEYRKEIINNLMKRNFDFNKITIEKCHGDYYVSQCIYDKEKIKCILDFSSAKIMPISIELIRSYIYLDNTYKNGKFDINGLKNYVIEFNKHYKLNKYDLEYMPYLYLIRLLRSNFGYMQYINDYDKKNEFLYFGNKLQDQIEFLYNNAEIISNKLKEVLFI